ncbi:MAG: hypothetical protein ACRBBP_10835, partial [Bdellovibrionales bacterium]
LVGSEMCIRDRVNGGKVKGLRIFVLLQLCGAYIKGSWKSKIKNQNPKKLNIFRHLKDICIR